MVVYYCTSTLSVLVNAKRPLAYSSVYCTVTRAVGSKIVGLSLGLRVRSCPVSGDFAVVTLAEARSDKIRSLLLLIVQGLIWFERRGLCFLLLLCIDPSR